MIICASKLLLAILAVSAACIAIYARGGAPPSDRNPDRSPVDVVLTKDGKWLLTFPKADKDSMK